MHRRAGAFLVAGAIIAGTLAFLPAARAGQAADVARFLADTNRERSSSGAPPLTANSALAGVAQGWSAQLAGSGHLAHNPNLVSQIDHEVTPDWRSYGENVGTGPDVESIQAAFVHSPEHHQNMVNPAFTEVGIAVSYASNGALWVTLDFLQPAPPHQVAVASAASGPPPHLSTPAPRPVAVAAPAPPARMSASVPVADATRAAPIEVLAEAVAPMQPAELPAPIDVPAPLRRPLHHVPLVLVLADAVLIAGVIRVAILVRPT